MGQLTLVYPPEIEADALRLLRKMGAVTVTSRRSEDLLDPRLVSVAIGPAIPDRRDQVSLLVRTETREDEMGHIVSITETYTWE